MAVNAQGQEAVIVRNGRVKVRIWLVNVQLLTPIPGDMIVLSVVMAACI